MPRRKIAITIQEGILSRLDRLITQGGFANRSRAIEQSIEAITDGWDQRTGLRGLIEDVRVKITGLEPKRRAASA